MIVVVGGHSRKIGKSAVVSAVLRVFASAGWTAIKISRHRRSTLAVHEAVAPGRGDSGRYLAAGAARSFWIEAAGARFHEVLPLLEPLLGLRPNAIIESTGIIRWLQPDLYLFVVDPSVADWKPSARTGLELASAFLVVDRGEAGPGVTALPPGPPRFSIRPQEYLPVELAELVGARLAQRASGSATSRVNTPPGPE